MQFTPLMQEKLMSAAEAVRRFVPDGAMVCLGGFTVNRNAMLIAREIIRQQRRDLHLAVHSHGQALDLLIGAGCVSKVELAYGGVARFAPTGIRFRDAASRGEILVEDYSNFHMSLRFLAGSLGLPFIPSRSGLGTDVLEKWGFGPEVRGTGKIPKKKMVVSQNPFAEEDDPVVMLPALTPDVCLLHAQYVGTGGTVRIKGLSFLDVEQARASDAVIVTCEEIVPEEHLREDPDQNTFPGFLVDAVIPAPMGAHPTACHQYYDYDPAHLKLYREYALDDDKFQRYLDEWVLCFDTQEEYLAKVGVADLERIKASRVLGYAPGLDRR
ncbi:MAG: hypothetical protein KQH53_08870 [Desulfarculaceae bacterium]|nr:hypothetical protein [Desulfarculaceae bacterium]